MNFILLEVELGLVEKRTTLEGKPLTNATATFYQRENQHPINLLAFGKMAEQLGSLESGSSFTVKGSMRIEKMQQESGTRNHYSLIVNEIIGAGDAVADSETPQSEISSHKPSVDSAAPTPARSAKASPSKASPSRPMVGAVAAPAQAVDYDDIPFMQPVGYSTCDDLIDPAIHLPRVGFEFRKF